MFFGLSRLLLPVVAFVAGTWVGMGQPPAEVMERAARVQAAKVWRMLRARVATQPAFATTYARPVVPEDPSPLIVDPGQLPDDPAPWPRLNPEASTRRAWLLAEGPARGIDEPHRYVTLTFDDGPFPDSTPDVLALLAKHHIRGAFFFVAHNLVGNGRWAEQAREAARNVAAAGHLVGNHTLDHELLTIAPRRRVIAEIDEGARVIEDVVGQRTVFFRPPYGQLDAFGEAAVRKRGLEIVLWNVEVGDMKGTDVDGMVERLEGQLDQAGGGIVLLHDIKPTSVEVLGKLLSWLERHPWDGARPDKKGYEVVDLVTYMRLTAASPMPYGSRSELDDARRAEWKRLHPKRKLPSVIVFGEGHDPVL